VYADFLFLYIQKRELKTGPKRTLEGEFLNGSVLQFSVPKLKIWKISQLMSTISTLILLGRQNWSSSGPLIFI